MDGMVGMENDSKDDQRWFMREARRRSFIKEDQTWLFRITDAIGDRRIQDLLDLVAETEIRYGWPTALIYLERAKNETYSVPAGIGGPRLSIEPLKYREALFALFSSSGVEPIATETSDLLAGLSSTISFASASNQFAASALSLARKQIESGDTIFFESVDGHSSAELESVLELKNHETLNKMTISKKEGHIDLLPLWHTDMGRKTLSQLGVGRYTTLDGDVLHDIQILLGVTIREDCTMEAKLPFPTHSDYRRLLQAIMDVDVQTLCSLGSKHAVHTLDFLLSKAISDYEEMPNTSNYQQYLYFLNAHVRVRAPGSVRTLQRILQMDDRRLSMPAICALQYFYDEQAVSTLIDIVCESRDDEAVSTAHAALKSMHSKSPVVEPLILETLDSSCRHAELLRTLLKMKRWTDRCSG